MILNIVAQLPEKKKPSRKIPIHEGRTFLMATHYCMFPPPWLSADDRLEHVLSRFPTDGCHWLGSYGFPRINVTIGPPDLIKHVLHRLGFFDAVYMLYYVFMPFTHLAESTHDFEIWNILAKKQLDGPASLTVCFGWVPMIFFMASPILVESTHDIEILNIIVRIPEY